MTDGDDVRSVPPSLLAGDLGEFWGDVARRLERNGADWRGRVRIADLGAEARMVLRSLGGDPRRVTVDLKVLESALTKLGVARDLPSALAVLGHPVSPEPAQRRATRQHQGEGRAAARAEAATWPESWAGDWIDEVIRSGVLTGLGSDDATAIVTAVRRVLDALDARHPERVVATSRTDLAATLLGSAHALDDGTPIERAAARALSLRYSDWPTSTVPAADPASDASATPSPGTVADPWRRAGVERNLLSGAALTWRLPLSPTHPLAEAVLTSSSLGLPFLVTRLAIETTGIDVIDCSEVLVVENPRVIEYGAQTGAPGSMVCANGNPSGTVVELIGSLIAAGARLTYHGDFDAAGLAICARMAALGLAPWRMTTSDYLAAVQLAEDDNVELPLDGSACGPTPWDPELQHAFNAHRRAVHEERLLHQIVGEQ